MKKDTKKKKKKKKKSVGIEKELGLLRRRVAFGTRRAPGHLADHHRGGTTVLPAVLGLLRHFPPMMIEAVPRISNRHVY